MPRRLRQELLAAVAVQPGRRSAELRARAEAELDVAAADGVDVTALRAAYGRYTAYAPGRLRIAAAVATGVLACVGLVAVPEPVYEANWWWLTPVVVVLGARLLTLLVDECRGPEPGVAAAAGRTFRPGRRRGDVGSGDD